MKQLARYRNPWHQADDDRYGPECYETDVRPTCYRDYLIYQRVRGAIWDVVRDEVCITQMAGLNGAKGAIDELIEKEAKG